MSVDKLQLDIHNFNIVKIIGDGTISTVYLVQNNTSNKEYAAKVIQLELDNNSNFIANHEIETLMKVHHSTIIRFLGFSTIDFDDQNHLTLIMAPYKKGPLNAILKNIQKGILDENYNNTTRQIILIGVARGMMFLHQQNIIHGNLKSENILLDDNYYPHLTDYGLYKYYQQFSFPHNFCSPVCMAPEIIKSNKYSDKSDVYSFGIVMFEIITDSFPYPHLQSGRVPLHTFYQRVENDDLRPEFPSDVVIKESLKNLMEKCWSTDPNDRPTFKDLFNKLAFNEGGKENEYYLDNIDLEKVQSYANSVKADE